MKKLFIVLILFSSCSLDALEEIKNCEPRENVSEEATIPFKFSDATPQYHKDIIYEAIAHYHSETPVIFKEYTTDEFFRLLHGVYMKYTGANSVNSGYFPYGQGDYITDLRMAGDRWFNLSTAIHELGHVVGLPHEFQRADRDEYLIIYWGNIPEQWHDNFKITTIDFETPLSEESIMHYDPYDIAIDKNKPTIEMIGGAPIKRTAYLTKSDINKINELYCFELSTRPE